MIPSCSLMASSGAAGGGGSRVSITNQDVYTSPGPASYEVNSDGKVYDQNGTILETWLLSGAAADYDVRATLVSGNSPTGASLGTWLNLASSHAWQETASLGSIKTCTLTIEIRDATTLTVLDTATVTVTADNS